MSVKVCGHEVRVHKTIKVYNFFKLAIMVVLLSAFCLMPALAAEEPMATDEPNIETSAGAVTPETNDAVPVRRTADSNSVSALALVMALGLRDVSGPVENAATTAPKVRHK